MTITRTSAISVAWRARRTRRPFIPSPQLLVTPTVPLPAYLKMIRIKAGFSQSGLAEAAGIDHSMIGRIESSQRTPSRQTLIFIAEALNMTRLERVHLFVAAGYIPRGWSACPSPPEKLRRMYVTVP